MDEKHEKHCTTGIQRPVPQRFIWRDRVTFQSDQEYQNFARGQADSSGPSKSDLVISKCHPVPPNESRRNQDPVP